MLSDGLKYQDSRMATCEEMKQDLAPFALHDAAAKSKGGPVLLRDGDTVYTDPSDSHSLIVGDTGSMKTLRFVLPLIYSCAAADESMVIVDPKGELARKSESFLSAKGYKTVIINMRDPQRSPDTWNPMGVIERAHKSGEEGQQKAVLQLNDMLNDIFFRRVDTKDPYWNESAGQLALGICLLLLALGEKLNMKNLLKWRYEKLADGTLDKCFRNLPTDGEIYQNLAGYLGMTAESTKSCIRSTFDQLVRVFKSAPALTEMLMIRHLILNGSGRQKRRFLSSSRMKKQPFIFWRRSLSASVTQPCLKQRKGTAGRCREGRISYLRSFATCPRSAISFR